jgi:hypothetical protein
MRYITLDCNGREGGFCYEGFLTHDEILKAISKLIWDMR